MLGSRGRLGAGLDCCVAEHLGQSAWQRWLLVNRKYPSAPGVKVRVCFRPVCFVLVSLRIRPVTGFGSLGVYDAALERAVVLVLELALELELGLTELELELVLELELEFALELEAELALELALELKLEAAPELVRTPPPGAAPELALELALELAAVWCAGGRRCSAARLRAFRTRLVIGRTVILSRLRNVLIRWSVSMYSLIRRYSLSIAGSAWMLERSKHQRWSCSSFRTRESGTYAWLHGEIGRRRGERTRGLLSKSTCVST